MIEKVDRLFSLIQCYVKYAIFALVLNGIVLVRSPIALMHLLKNDGSNDLTLAKWSHFLAKFCLGMDLQVEGQENVQHNGCIVIMNHQSILDTLIMLELRLTMVKLKLVARKLIFYVFPLSWLLGLIYINRDQPQNAIKTLNTMVTRIRDKKVKLLICPEGTRNSSSELKPFKKGAFHLAIASGCPIQPVVVSRLKFLGKHRFDSGRVLIRILPQIDTVGFTNENIDELVTHAYNTMSAHLDQVDSYNESFLRKNSKCF